MSILETPRIYFRGQIAWDPVTTNNFEPATSPTTWQQAAYDEDAVNPTIGDSAVRPDSVDDFRRAAIAEVPPAPEAPNLSSWNPDGTYRSTFFDTQVSGVDTGQGLDTSDPFVTAPVSFRGMLIDAEPYGPFSSQLFFDEMSFGIPGGCRVLGKRVRRFDDRNINFFANRDNAIIAGVASVSWQTVFDKRAGLAVDDFDSPALRAVRAALASDDVLGLTVRWNSYRTIYFNNPEQRNNNPAQFQDSERLMEMLRLGGWQPNPARSLIVGALGLWRRGECATEPSERTLVSTLATIPGQPAPGAGPAVGTAYMRLDLAATPPTLTLDLQNSIPCRTQATDKFDLGTLSILAADPPPAVAIEEVAQVPFGLYDRAAYEATSGIVTVELPSAQALENMVISIKGPDGAPTYLAEMRYRALPAQPNLYADQHDLVALLVQGYDRGRPAGAGLTVTWSLLLDEAGDPPDTTHWTAITDANGRVQVPVDTSTGNIYAYVFQVGSDPVLPVTGDNFNPLIFTYAYIRVLPSDDDLLTLEPSWDNVYARVLAGFKAIAPCMDNWLRLDDRQQVEAYGPLVRRLTDPDAFEEFRYMPATRDLSRGQRALLYRWLDGETTEPGQAEEAAAPAAALASATAPDFASLAGAQRGGARPGER